MSVFRSVPCSHAVRYLYFTAILISGLTLFNVPAHAVCSNPAGAAGDVLYNDDYDVLQYCKNTQWISVHVTRVPTGCSTIGQECSDGSVYAGLSPDGNVKMYTTHCDAGMSWNGSACTGASRTTFAYNNGNASGDTLAGTSSTTDGDGNTVLLLSTDADGVTGGVQPHQAGQYCGNLTDLGHTDWYLPAQDELAVLRTNRVAIGGFELNAGATGSQRRLWSSTESSQFIAVRQNMPDGVQGAPVKDELNTARCVRTQPVSTGCASPTGTKGDILYSSSEKVLQYCGGDNQWRAMGRIGGPAVSCDTTVQTYTTPGTYSFSIPMGCDTVQVEGFGAGGSGAGSGTGKGGSGGGGGSVVRRASNSQLLVAGAGGGGAGGGDSGAIGGGGGGYATATASVTGGESLDIWVGGGGTYGASETGGNGGAVNGGNGGSRPTNGGNSDYGGAGGGGRDAKGGNSSTAGFGFGGAGGSGEDGTGGGNSIYGGAGGAGKDSGGCGTSTNGGACSTRNGGGGGGYSVSGGTVTLGSNGTTRTAANSGPGTGGQNNTIAAGNGKVVVTPSGPPGGGAMTGPCTSPTAAEGDIIYNSSTNTLQYCTGLWVSVGR